MSRRSCITGGAGFIGSHCVDFLLSRGDEVVILDDLSTGQVENIHPDAIFIEGSVCSDVDVAEAVRGCQNVYHLASRVSVVESIEHPGIYEEVTALGTRRVLEKSRDCGVERVVLASSCSVYGDAEVPTAESAPLRPLSPYASSKLQAEVFCREYAQSSFSTIVLRFFNVFGIRQRADSPYAGVIARFMDAMEHGQPPTVFGDGLQTRDFIHVSDVVRALMLAGEKEMTGDGSAFNVGSGKEISINDLIQMIGCLPPKGMPHREGEVRRSCADISRAREELKFTAVCSVAEGLRTIRK